LLLFFFSTPLILRRSTKTQQSSITACRQQSPAANLASLQQLLIHRNKSSQNSQKFPKKNPGAAALSFILQRKTRARRTRTRGGSRRRRTRDKNKTSKHKDNGENLGNQSRMNLTRKTVPPLPPPPPPLLAQSQMPRRMTLTESEKTKQKIGNLTNFTLFLNFVLVLVLFFCSFFGDKSGRWIFLFPQSFFLILKKKNKKVEDAESCCRDANTRVGEPREITSKKQSDSCSSWKEGRKEDEQQRQQQHKKTNAKKCTTRVGPGFERRKKTTLKPPSKWKKKKD
jgi:hypothetical protein